MGKVIKRSKRLIEGNKKLIVSIENLKEERRNYLEFAKKYADEDEILRSNILLEKIFNNSFSVMFIINKDTEVVKMNNPGLKFSGKGEFEVCGERGGNIFSCVNVALKKELCGTLDVCKKCKLRNYVQDTVHNGVSHNKVEIPFNSFIDGEERELYFQLSSVVINETSEKLILVVLDDITKNKQLERETAESLRLYQEIFENSKDGIAFTNDEGRFLNANKAYCEQLGYSLNELRGLDCYSVTPKKWHYWENEEILEKRLLTKGYSGVYEKEYKRKDGSVFPVELQVHAHKNKKGKLDYMYGITRDISEQNIELKAIEQRLIDEKIYLKEEIKRYKSFDCIVTNDPNFISILEQVGQVAETDSTVFINGETGTGKELVARAIHDISERNNKEFVCVNCAAIPETLFESELFGCEKGAYTGADKQRIGKLEQANGGTLFLDEIGEMPINLQPKLLRALQEREIERVGGNEKIKLNIRIVVATHRDIELEVKEGRFRRDLFYRLNVFPVTLPPLRERLGDLSLLVSYYIKKYSGNNKKIDIRFTKKDLNRLLNYSWPGNVRELANVVERAIVTNRNGILDVSSFIPNHINSDESNTLLTLENMEKKYIKEVLDKTKGKIGGESGAAAILGLKRTTLISKMKKLGM